MLLKTILTIATILGLVSDINIADMDLQVIITE